MQCWPDETIHTNVSYLIWCQLMKIYPIAQTTQLSLTEYWASCICLAWRPFRGTVGCYSRAAIFYPIHKWSLSPGIICSIVADDTKIAGTVESNNDVITLQWYVNNLYAWSQKWDLNARTCMALLANTTRNKWGKGLNHLSETVDLGISLDSKFSCQQHINTA